MMLNNVNFAPGNISKHRDGSRYNTSTPIITRIIKVKRMGVGLHHMSTMTNMVVTFWIEPQRDVGFAIKNRYMWVMPHCIQNRGLSPRCILTVIMHLSTFHRGPSATSLSS